MNTNVAEKTESAEPSKPTSAEDLTLADMMKILDVAHDLQSDRENVHEQLTFDQAKARIRERLMASRDVIGGEFNEAELDAAVELYFQNLHRYAEPKGMNATLAHLYIRRNAIGTFTVALVGTTLAVWALFFSTIGPWSPTYKTNSELRGERTAVERIERDLKTLSLPAETKNEADRLATAAETHEAARDPAKMREARRQLETLANRVKAAKAAEELAAQELTAVRNTIASAKAIAKEGTVLAELDRMAKQAEALSGAQNPQRLTSLREQAADLEDRLSQQFEVRVQWRAGAKTGLIRRSRLADGSESPNPTHYLIVKSIDKSGKDVATMITDQETGQTQRVSIWAEAVPEAVFNRVRDDKKDDGVLNQDLFGTKARGYLQVETTFPDAAGTPLSRGGQLLDPLTRLKETAGAPRPGT